MIERVLRLAKNEKWVEWGCRLEKLKHRQIPANEDSECEGTELVSINRCSSHPRREHNREGGVVRILE
jgi:hypothetical protein